MQTTPSTYKQQPSTCEQPLLVIQAIQAIPLSMQLPAPHPNINIQATPSNIQPTLAVDYN